MAQYFVRRLRWGEQLEEQFWCIEEEKVYQIDVVSSSGLSVCPRAAGETVRDVLDKIMKDGEWYELSLKPGEYFPRMARPDSTNKTGPGRNPDTSDEFRFYRARSTGQLHAFIQELEHICGVIHPEGSNLQCFGHATRNILILACTEVEAHWKKILEANGYENTERRDRRLNTEHYVTLLDAMRLDQYVVSLNYYPWLSTAAPFQGWNREKPTKSLPWYNAHNLVKHNREEHFAEATLERALTAVTACFVMLCAQYGWDFALQGEEGGRAFFQLVEWPTWSPSEIYVPPFEDGRYKPLRYQFHA